MYMGYYPEEFRHAVFEGYGSDAATLEERSRSYDRIYGLYDRIEHLRGDPAQTGLFVPLIQNAFHFHQMLRFLNQFVQRFQRFL